MSEITGLPIVAAEDELSTALLIGLGGTGIQTITRVARSLRAGRRDSTARDNIDFLGLDVVQQPKQTPPIPEGSQLQPAEYVNLAEGQGINAYQLYQHHAAMGGDVAEFWYPSYKAPDEPLIDGLKQSRPLGRLAHYAKRQDIQLAISRAIDRTQKIHQENVRDGLVIGDGNGQKLQIFVVSSTCGGTGSSFTLPVLREIHLACAQKGLVPTIRLVAFLPGAFRRGADDGMNAIQEKSQLATNAFGFLTELDHFIVHPETLSDYFGGVPLSPHAVLVEQVILMDATIGGVGANADIKDLYETAAEAIYQFLMTGAGRPIVGQLGVNSHIHETFDLFDRPRRYSSVGVASVIFPGDTLRTHLDARYRHWFISEVLLERQANLQQRAIGSGVPETAFATLQGWVEDIGRVEWPTQVADFLDEASRATGNLVARPEVAQASSTVAFFQTELPGMSSDLKEVLAAEVTAKRAQLGKQLATALTDSGQSLPFLAIVAQRLQSQLSASLNAAQQRKGEIAGSISLAYSIGGGAEGTGEGSIQACLAQLRKLEGRGWLNHLPFTTDPEAVAKDLGAAVASYVANSLQICVVDAQISLLEGLVEGINNAVRELTRAEQILVDEAADLLRLWRSDDLKGKDMAPRATTTYVPSDIAPEVEDSVLAIEVFREVSEYAGPRFDSEDKAGAQNVATFYREWFERGGGPLALGSDNARASQDSLKILNDLLSEQVKAFVLHDELSPSRDPRLPSTLPLAAQRVGGASVLDAGLKGLATLAGSVHWSYNAARMRLHSDAAPVATYTVVSRAPELQDQVAAAVPTGTAVVNSTDPERVIALTLQQGVTAHALTEALAWQIEYESVRQLYRSHENHYTGHTPAHLDVRFETDLQPLMPTYFDHKSVASQIARGLILGVLPDDPKKSFDSLFEFANRKAPVALSTPTVAAEGFVAQQLLITVAGKIAATGQPNKAGGSIEELFNTLGSRIDIGQSFLRAWEVARTGTEPTALKVVVDGYRSAMIPSLEGAFTSQKDREFLLDIADALSDLSTSLSSLANRAAIFGGGQPA